MLTHFKYLSTFFAIIAVLATCSKNRRVEIDLLPAYYATPTSIKAGGYIVEWGNKDITSRGICYGLHDLPTIEDDYTESTSPANDRLFNCTVENLISDTTYYICAFAKKSNGTVSYSPQVQAINTQYTVGSTGPAGGTVFAVDGNGGGMEVIELSEYGEVLWGCPGVSTGADNTNFGSGTTNTSLIVSSCGVPNSAALVCDEFVLNSYSDWFLPSLDELLYLHLTLYSNDLLELNSSGFFWSSTEQNSMNAWAVLFFEGSPQNISKNSNARILAVRTF